MSSIRFFSPASKSSQRGFALIAAVILAILYFALIALLLIDSARELNEARRFRARVVAATLAENGAELAALSMLTRDFTTDAIEDDQGSMSGSMQRTGNSFVILGNGETKGLTKSSARVEISGQIYGNDIRIQYSTHTP